MTLMPNILLVDDEERFVDSLHSILEHYDYKCTKALSGSEAIEFLKEQHFDLALLDMELPDMSGCDILEYIKKSCKNTTAIMLTGISTVETAVAAMKQGAYDFLSKPINHELLLKTIDKALEHNKLTWKLEVSEKRFQALAEASWEGIVIHENGTFIEANNQFFTMFGYTEPELRDSAFLEKILTPDSLEVIIPDIKSSIYNSHEITGVKKDGTQFPVETNTRSINFLGRPARVCAIRDLSDRVRAEEEKFALQEKLAKANKLKALGLMAGSVAHDLNNILSGVVSYPDLLLSQMNESDRFYREITKIQAAGKRAAAVVADLVVLARGGSSAITIESVNDIILNHLSSIEHCERLANFPNVIIQTNLQQDLHNIRCSRQNIHKIILNLIGNALDAIQNNGKIKITTENCRFINPVSPNSKAQEEGDYVKITLADNGQGIPKKDIEHVFDPFYTTKVMGKSGTGLGLSIVWNTVREYNGWVEVKNQDQGVVFEIYLPVTMEKRADISEVKVSQTWRGHGETILLIDDQPEQNDTMGKLLNSLGYKTFSASSGEEGIQFIKSQSVDLVLLDMMMGDGLNGSETYEQILQIHPQQKAIIISGYSKDEDVLKAKALGVTHFLEKPVTLPKISRAINQLLSRA